MIIVKCIGHQLNPADFLYGSVADVNTEENSDVTDGKDCYLKVRNKEIETMFCLKILVNLLSLFEIFTMCTE